LGAGHKLADKIDEKRAEGEVRKRREADEGVSAPQDKILFMPLVCTRFRYIRV
jgi:hypothetical protein